MTNHTLTCLSPVDGRYAAKVDMLRPIFSEYGLNRHRVIIEIKWLQFLSQISGIKELKPLTKEANSLLEGIISHFTENDGQQIKDIEKTTNHDVKAVEYFIKEKITGNKELEGISEFIHFACTSEDINNLSYALMLKNAREKCLLPLLDEILQRLTKMAHDYAEVAMLARTHGQPATPTTVGKEMANFVARLQTQRKQLLELAIQGKINGAVGNFNAHHIAYPQIKWDEVGKKFVEELGLSYNAYTTQIEPHDYIAGLSHNLIRINNILIDLARDIWGYISLNYFKQRMISGEIGSSTMPHKVNPIDFENAEGNAYIANALFDLFANRLPISRWQRDLTDSTLLRNLGVAIGHSLITYQSLLRGLDKLDLNQEILQQDLAQHGEVLAEAIQTVMRAHGIANPYEKLKEFTRGKKLDQKSIQEFIQGLELPKDAKERLMHLTPGSYIGIAAKLAKEVG